MPSLKSSVYALGLASLVIFGANSAFASEDKCSVNGPLISVTGQGQVKAMPDLVTLNYRVSAIKDTADAARREVEKTVTAFSRKYANLKLPQDSFVADDININPRYEYKNNERIFVGYDAGRNVTIKLDDFTLIPKVNDLALAAGINQISGFNYTLKDPKKYQQEAQKKAIANALEQAELLAKGFGVKIIQPCQISFGGNYPIPVMYRAAKANVALEAAAAPSVDSTYTSNALEINSSVQASFIFEKK